MYAWQYFKMHFATEIKLVFPDNAPDEHEHVVIEAWIDHRDKKFPEQKKNGQKNIFQKERHFYFRQEEPSIEQDLHFFKGVRHFVPRHKDFFDGGPLRIRGPGCQILCHQIIIDAQLVDLASRIGIKIGARPRVRTDFLA